jgi:hypothetical protein
MARIEWAQLCELAFLDNCGRLCMVGITNRFPVPSLPLAVTQIMIAARVVAVRPGEEFDVSLSVAMPNVLWTAPDDAASVALEIPVFLVSKPRHTAIH